MNSTQTIHGTFAGFTYNQSGYKTSAIIDNPYREVDGPANFVEKRTYWPVSQCSIDIIDEDTRLVSVSMQQWLYDAKWPEIQEDQVYSSDEQLSKLDLLA